ncbi:MAG: hypothetical protein JETT_1495 [Candidatus Jettenia ecosi]|uniref:Uncharacterized protein n=1 Tax=Candidatus Jettenia ecosi TaxID=2494326 RepID=A0A533QC54_9BACT|nr:MAG: hypothetical protein JETT_1495 [Candidatus Jettenia ecosi]
MLKIKTNVNVHAGQSFRVAIPCTLSGGEARLKPYPTFDKR